MWKQIKYQVRQPKVTKNLHYAITQRIMVIAKYSIVFLVVNLQWAFWCFDFLVCDNEFRTTSCTVVGSVDCVNKRCWKDRHAMIYPVIVSRVPPLLTMIQLEIFDFWFLIFDRCLLTDKIQKKFAPKVTFRDVDCVYFFYIKKIIKGYCLYNVRAGVDHIIGLPHNQRSCSCLFIPDFLAHQTVPLYFEGTYTHCMYDLFHYSS